MALELTLDRRTIWVAKQLARRPEFYWENLGYEDKLRIYKAPIELDTIPQDKIREFEREMALKGDRGIGAKIRAVTEDKIPKLTE
jgi:hypothetical protein